MTEEIKEQTPLENIIAQWLSQKDIEKMTPEEYSYFLSYAEDGKCFDL